MAGYARLYIFHAGPDDERSLRHVVESRWLGAYDYVDLVAYAGKPGGYVRRFISGIDTTPGADYVYLCDLDTVSSVAVRKQAVKDRIPNIDEGKIVVVVPEIEAWYLAGLDEQRCRALGIP